MMVLPAEGRCGRAGVPALRLANKALHVDHQVIVACLKNARTSALKAAVSLLQSQVTAGNNPWSPPPLGTASSVWAKTCAFSIFATVHRVS